jgi:hypothetical protein
MSRFLRVTILLAAATALCATGSLANVPDPELSEVPPVLSVSPTTEITVAQGGLQPLTFAVTVIGATGPVAGSFVELEFGPEADELISWCTGQTHPVLSGISGSGTWPPGVVEFDVLGGGCITPGAYPGAAAIWTLTADGILLAEGYVTSPDAVNAAGKLPTDSRPGGKPRLDGGLPNCEDPDGDGTYTTESGLGDAVFFTRPFATGEPEECAQFGPPWVGPIDLTDTVLATAYLKNSGTCTCTPLP